MDQKKGPRKGLGLAEDDLSNTGVGWTEREKDCSQRGWMSCWPINYSKRVIMAGVQESGHNKPFSKKICGNLIIYVYVYIYKKNRKIIQKFRQKSETLKYYVCPYMNSFNIFLLCRNVVLCKLNNINTILTQMPKSNLVYILYM